MMLTCKKNIIIGTTPTIIFKFKCVDVSNIKNAILTISRYGYILLRKDLQFENVNPEKNVIFFGLSQSETLNVGVGMADICLNWTIGHIRGTSKKCVVEFIDNPLKEEIL